MITGEIWATDTQLTNQNCQIILSVSFHNYGSAHEIECMAMSSGELSVKDSALLSQAFWKSNTSLPY